MARYKVTVYSETTPTYEVNADTESHAGALVLGGEYDHELESESENFIVLKSDKIVTTKEVLKDADIQFEKERGSKNYFGLCNSNV